MPWGLMRFHDSGQSHFVTFCCYHRRRLLTTDESRRIFESALERVRLSFRLQVYGYVVMPEHVHLLLSEPQRESSSAGTAANESTGGPFKPSFGLSGALKSLKQGVSRRLIADAEHFWQKRYGSMSFTQGRLPEVRRLPMARQWVKGKNMASSYPTLLGLHAKCGNRSAPTLISRW